MKKTNRNIVAYTRHPQHSQQQDPKKQHTGGNTSPNQAIYRAIIQQMNPDHSNYISKLVLRNNREQQRNQEHSDHKNSTQTHQRTQSYADLILATPTNSIVNEDSRLSYRGHEKKKQNRNLFLSRQPTPTNQKPIRNGSHSAPKQNQNNQFLNSIDSYLQILASNDSSSSGEKEWKEERMRERQRKTILKSNSNGKILDRLQLAETKIKELKLRNHVLETQNQELKIKKDRLKNKMKIKYQELFDYAGELTYELEAERYERKKMEGFFHQIQRKFTRLRPERKTVEVNREIKNKRVHCLEDFFVSSSTDLEQSNHSLFERPRSLKHHYSRVHRKDKKQYAPFIHRLQLSEEESEGR